jgi:hypothetical protein
MHVKCGSSYRSDQGGSMMAASDLVGILSWCYNMVITRQSVSDYPVTAMIKRRKKASVYALW